jgi:hypothetical protein
MSEWWVGQGEGEEDGHRTNLWLATDQQVAGMRVTIKDT